MTIIRWSPGPKVFQSASRQVIRGYRAAMPPLETLGDSREVADFGRRQTSLGGIELRLTAHKAFPLTSLRLGAFAWTAWVTKTGASPQDPGPPTVMSTDINRPTPDCLTLRFCSLVARHSGFFQNSYRMREGRRLPIAQIQVAKPTRQVRVARSLCRGSVGDSIRQIGLERQPGPLVPALVQFRVATAPAQIHETPRR